MPLTVAALFFLKLFLNILMGDDDPPQVRSAVKAVRKDSKSITLEEEYHNPTLSGWTAEDVEYTTRIRVYSGYVDGRRLAIGRTGNVYSAVVDGERIIARNATAEGVIDSIRREFRASISELPKNKR